MHPKFYILRIHFSIFHTPAKSPHTAQAYLNRSVKK